MELLQQIPNDQLIMFAVSLEVAPKGFMEREFERIFKTVTAKENVLNAGDR